MNCLETFIQKKSAHCTICITVLTWTFYGHISINGQVEEMLEMCHVWRKPNQKKLFSFNTFRLSVVICPLKTPIISNAICISDSFNHSRYFFNVWNNNFIDKLYLFGSVTGVFKLCKNCLKISTRPLSMPLPVFQLCQSLRFFLQNPYKWINFSPKYEFSIAVFKSLFRVPFDQSSTFLSSLPSSKGLPLFFDLITLLSNLSHILIFLGAVY